MLLVAAFMLGALSSPSGEGAIRTSSGPDLAEKAIAIDLPITEVMVFSDRARVTRRGDVKGSGPRVVRAPDIPGGVLLDSVRVTAAGLKVVRVETRSVERERWSIDQVDQWIVDLEKRSDELAIAVGALQIARTEITMLANIPVALPLPEKDRLGQTTTPATTAWKDAQDRLEKRRLAARATEAELEKKVRALRTAYEAAQREVLKRDLGGFSDQKIEVLVIVDGGAGSLAVDYAVPGAFWKPAYDLGFDPDKGTVELKASGLVTQATGEDWPQVKLALSTAVPGTGIDLPQLRTWTLGDDREYVPSATARTTPRTTRPFLPPTPKPRLAELEREADQELLATRTDLLLALASTGSDVRGGGARNMATKSVSQDAELLSSSPSVASSSMMPAAAARPMEMVDHLEAARDEAMPISQAVRSNAKSEPMRRQSLALRSGIGWRRQTFADPFLPAVSAGGFDYVYDAPVKVTVRSQAEGVRVPLAARKYAVRTFYEATPSLATTAYLKATVDNGSALPILAGPANVFVNKTFAGDAQLATTGPGGALELPLGADEDIRLTRTVVPVTKRQGLLFGEEDVTDYAVKIEVGNYKKRAITVRLIDQLPRTDAEKLKIELLSTSPKPQPVRSSTTTDEEPGDGVTDGDGLMSWHVDVPAGGIARVTFTYRITRPKNWRLSQ